MYEIMVREPLTPVVLPSPKFRGKRIIAVPVSFEHEVNRMVVFKVVPHANVAANNQRLWYHLHKMYGMYSNPLTRLERDGLKFRYREKDSLWVDVVFKRRGGKNKVEFFVGTTEMQAEKLKRRLENMMHVTIKDAVIKDVEVPMENTVVKELRYVRHDMFSLNTKVERNTPTASVLNTVDELVHEGDMARLSICVDHEDRKQWAKNVMWAHEKLQKGRVPQRIGLTQFLPVAKKGLAGFANGVNAFLQDMLEAVHNAFYMSDKPIEKNQIVDAKNMLMSEINATKLSNASLSKKNLPVFRTHIRVAAHSKDRVVRDTIAETLSTGISDTSEDNELQAISARGKATARLLKEMNELRLERQTRMDPNVNLTSTDELSKLALQLPDRDLQRKYAEEMNAKYRIEAEVPAALRTGMGIPLATATIKDRILSVDMPVANVDALYRAFVFVGGQGVGKDTGAKNFIIHATLKHNISALVIDAINEPGERGMADGIRDALPANKVIDLDLGNEEYVVPMDLTEVMDALGDLGADRFADEVVDLLDLGEHSQARSLLQAAARASGGSLLTIKKILENEKFRGNAVKKMRDAGDEWSASDLERWGDNKALGSKADPILNRLDRYFGNRRLRGIFSQDPHPEVNFAKWMSEGKVIIIRIPNRKLGELATKTLVHWVTLKFFMTRMLMNKKEKSNGAFIVFNEPEQYASEGLTKLMGRIGTEGRKERMGSLFCFHHWNKLPKSLQENLMGGGVNLFMFANDHKPTFEMSAHRFIDTVPMEQAEHLPQHFAILSLRAAGELQPAFIAEMNPPIEAKYNNSGLTVEHAKRFGRHWKELQARKPVERVDEDDPSISL